MAVEEQAPPAERSSSPHPGSGAAAARGLLIAPETGALFGATVMFVIFAFIAPSPTRSRRGRRWPASRASPPSSASSRWGHAADDRRALRPLVGSVLGFSSVIAPYLILNYDTNPFVAVLASVGVAISIGLINGLLVVGTIPSFIVTLGTLLIWRSVLLRVTEGFPVAVDKDTFVFKLLYRIQDGFFRGYQVSLLWFRRARPALVPAPADAFGNWIFASGGNERSARSMGVPVDRVWIILFVVTALCACLMGLIQVGRFNTVEATRVRPGAAGDRAGRRRRSTG